MATKKVTATKNYRLFVRSDANRPLDIKKHKKLESSMKKYGFLDCFPIVVHRDKSGKLLVKDGQHRLAVAETLGLTVFFVEAGVDFDTAEINDTQKTWGIRDYALTHSANGLKAYQEGLEFAEQYGIAVGTAFSMLAGTTSFGNIKQPYKDGTFKVRDREWADSVASVYGPMTQLSVSLRNKRFLEACMAVCRVEDFDAARLIHSANRCREKLVAYATRDAYLTMLEDVYNFSRSKLFGLKLAATVAMRERNAVFAKSKQKKTKVAAV